MRITKLLMVRSLITVFLILPGTTGIASALSENFAAGEKALKNGDVDKAVGYFEAAVNESAPFSGDRLFAMQRLCRIYAGQGKHEQAIANIKKTIGN